MVQNPPYWNANCALGHSKERSKKEDLSLNDLSRFVLDVPVRSLRSSMADFVPCDSILQRAYCYLVTRVFPRLWSVMCILSVLIGSLEYLPLFRLAIVITLDLVLRHSIKKSSMIGKV